MARPFTGQGSLEAARKARDEVRTADELRIALAVLLPLEAGLNLAQTALVLGRSRHTTCALRTDFCAYASGLRATRRWPAPPRARCWSSRV
jgi:hypothetical protein